ncbi:heterogeneous nuclear ribonucleoprotein A3 homolog 1-like [Dioscorea cayenensis subsp. rotundata]|uniref:Heterogeneous nuclear ribonucleoprotein A3 homolog 1-like n=1 Tax=Dioscorea cayennensis subsp. rotundata TaxID=55577 RepID=A0AB40AYV3_DIOCR|nr:heterogeneous nuclear ribonucleoprotein A3 homolog 1-like [Dioscorea cayenensis subsp. rotundata]
MEDSMEDSEEEEEDITMEGEVDDSITLSKFQEGIRKETPVWKGSHMILKFQKKGRIEREREGWHRMRVSLVLISLGTVSIRDGQEDGPYLKGAWHHNFISNLMDAEGNNFTERNQIKNSYPIDMKWKVEMEARALNRALEKIKGGACLFDGGGGYSVGGFMGVLGGVLGPIIEGGAGLFDSGGGIMGVGGGGGVKGGRGGGGHGEVGEEEDGGDFTLAFANVHLV